MKQQSKPPTSGEKSKNQGEGNRDAARRYNEDQQEFVKSGKVNRAANEAKPDSAEVAAELERAEKTGRSHAKGEDPTVPGANAKRTPSR